jgi:hypothetical protein
MTSNHPDLNRLPTDVLEGVVALLPLQDICNLRLVSRAVATKSSRGVFRKHFTTKTVKWTSTEQMEEFVHLTQPHGVGCLLQHLTVIGIAPAPPADQEHSLDELLSKALANLRLNSTHGCLQTIVLLVQGQDNNTIIPCSKMRDWRQVWLTAARTFEILCHALAESALPIIQKLDIFDRVSGCSLACDQIGPIFGRIDLSKSLEKLRCLSLSLSHHAAEDLNDKALGKGFAEDISRLLELCPQLESLDLHWYQLYAKLNENDTQIEERRFFSHIVQSKQVSQLRNCQLKGIYTNEAALLAFLQKATELVSFSMEEVHLEVGKFGPIFNCLTTHLRHLEHLHLDDLWESRLICFECPGQPHFPSSAANGPNAITRIGADCQLTIKYRMTRGHALGSAPAANWHRRKVLQYGPPSIIFP